MKDTCIQRRISNDFLSERSSWVMKQLKKSRRVDFCKFSGTAAYASYYKLRENIS